MREVPHARWSELPIDEVLRQLAAGREGLSSAEADRRLKRHGPNELPREGPVSPLCIVLHQIKSPLMDVLLVAGAITILLGNYIDAGVILLVVAIDALVSFTQQYKAQQALNALARMVAPKARVLRDGDERQVDARLLVPGDVILLETGVTVPADVRLLRALDLSIDESVLTGESVPVSKTTEPLPLRDTRTDTVNLALMGTSVVRGRGAGVVVATGTQTTLGTISAEMRRIGEVETPLQARLARFAGLLALVVVGVTVLVFVLGLLRGETLTDIFLTAVATAVATVPEGLPVATAIALAVGAWRMAERHAIIRKLPAVEALGSCTTICADKTGTLTKNEMTVTRVYVGGHVFDVTGTGYVPRGEILSNGKRVDLRDEPSLAMALRIGLLCNESSVYEKDGRYGVDGDPTEAALVVAALKGGLWEEDEREDYLLLDEIPFEPDQQYMATLHRHENDKFIFVKGAPERVVTMCRAARLDNKVAPLDRVSVLEQANCLASQGLRVLAVAYRTVPPEVNEIGDQDLEGKLVFVGLHGMIDPPRPEAVTAVAQCQRAGIRVVMITGDHVVTALAIARQMGIVAGCDAPALDGRQLNEMTEDELFEQVTDVSVYARATPDQKLRVVRQLRRRGEIVAVTGDGVNDGPALEQADIGVAMGIAGTDVAREAADMVLADDNFASIYAAVEQGRVVFDNIRKVTTFLIPTGLALTVVASIVLGLPLPFLPAQAIWINLVTSGTQHIALAFEPPEGDVGRRPPRSPHEGLLTSVMLQRIVLVGVTIMIGTILAFVWQLTADSGLVHARTVATTTSVLFQNFHALNCRSLTRSFVRSAPLGNPFLIVSVAAALGLQVVALYWPPLRYILRTEPLDLTTWLVMIGVASTVLVAVEVEKAFRHARPRECPGDIG